MQKFALLLRARTPLIWLDTMEEDRAIDIVCAMAREAGDPVTGWSRGMGLHNLPGAGNAGARPDPLPMLEFVRRNDTRGFWVLKDFGALIEAEGQTVVRALRDTIAVAERRGSVLTCLGGRDQLPGALRTSATYHRLTPPGPAEHARVIDEVTREAGRVVDTREKHKLARACQGMALQHARDLWKRLLRADGRLSADDIDLVVEEKARQFGHHEFLVTFPPPSPRPVEGG